MNDTVTNTQDAPSSPGAPGESNNVINITDLQNILVVIDLASNRGAFRGNELEPIGQLYNKIGRFVQAALPPQQEQSDAPPPPPAGQGA